MEVFNLDRPGSCFSADIDRIEKRLRVPFTEFTDRLGRDKGDSLDWWVSNLASRNVFSSPLYFLCCRLTLMAELARSGAIRRVRTADPWTREIVRRYIRTSGAKIEIEEAQKRYRWSSRLARMLENFRFFREYLQLWNDDFLARRRAARRTCDLKRSISGPITLIEFYLSESRFDDSGEMVDPYFSGLTDFLDEREKKDLFFIFSVDDCFSYESLYRKARLAKNNFLIKEDFLRTTDYIYAFLFPLRFTFFRFSDTSFGSFDLGPAVRYHAAREKFLGVSIEALLNYRAIHGLRRAGVAVRLLVDWFENQWMDKGLHRAFRECYPESEAIGYQGFVFSKVHLSVFPTSSELRAGVVPRTVGVAGPGYIEERKEFCPELKTEVVPAFRFGHTHRPRRTEPESEPFVILVALPQILEIAGEILLALETIQPSLPGVDIRIKPHPTVSPGVLESFPSFQENVRYVGGNIRDHLDQAHLVVLSESGTAMEALVLGIPVIVYTGAAAPSKIPIPEDVRTDMWKLCYDAKELLEGIADFRKSIPHWRNEWRLEGGRIREKYFAPVTREAVRGLLRLKN